MLARLLRRAQAAAADSLPAARAATAAAKAAPTKRAVHTSSKLLKDLKTDYSTLTRPLTTEEIAAIAAEREEHLVDHVRRFAANEFDGVTAETVRDNLVREVGTKKWAATIGGKIVIAAVKHAGANMLENGHMTTTQEVVRVLKHPDAVYGNVGAFKRLATPMSEGGRYSQVLVSKDGQALNNGSPVIFTKQLIDFVLDETRNGYAWQNATPAQKAGAALALAGEWGKLKQKANLRLEGADPLDKKALVKAGNPNAALLPMWKRPVASVQSMGESLGVLKPATPATKR